MIDSTILNNFAFGAAATVPIVIAITQAFKMMNFIPDKFIPFVSMIVGVLVAILLTHDFMNDLSGTILTGILFGLSASGLYSSVKSTGQAIAKEKALKAQKERDNAEKIATCTEK